MLKRIAYKATIKKNYLLTMLVEECDVNWWSKGSKFRTYGVVVERLKAR